MLREGHNCWKLAQADRLAFLIDGEAYFTRLAEALENARRQVLVLGWDVNSRVPLRRDASGKGSDPFAELVDRVARRRNVQVGILNWDFAMVYALEREPLPTYHFGWKTHRNVRFALDDRHPLGASHHQKVVVVDDAVAFTGGFDITIRRWDTSDHDPDDARRDDGDGERYGPFHDIQIAVSGEAARRLGELARERWRRATGERLETPAPGAEAWPDSLEPDLENVEVGIARTEPEFDGRPEVREVEAWHLDTIAGARRFLYFENQYFTSDAIAEALRERLAEDDPPEVVMVLPRRASGWLEEATMSVVRSRLVRGLREADRHDRLRILAPHRKDLGDERINVHSKVLMADDRAGTVGSANLSNRSMGLDTECNVVLQAGDDDDDPVHRALAAFRNRLLAEHLGVTSERVAGALEEHGSLIAAVESLTGGDRTLELLPDEPEQVPEWMDELIPEPAPFDPERPMRARDLTRRLLPDGSRSTGGAARPRMLAAIALVLLVGGLAAAWRWGPLGEWLPAERIGSWIEAYRDSPWALPLTVALYVVGSLVMLPITVLILQTALVFDPWTALLHATLGSLSAALATFGLGRGLGRSFVRKVSGKLANRIRNVPGHGKLVAVSVVRLVPVAPFSVVNLVFGASGLSVWTFVAGTLLGLAPGIVALTLVGDRAMAALRDPGPWTIVVAVGIGGAAFLGLGLLGRWLRRRAESEGDESDDG